MPGSENFNTGTAPGWTFVNGIAVVNGEGPDASHALVATLTGDNAYYPFTPCEDSQILTVTFDWRRDMNTVGSGVPFVQLVHTGLSGDSPWNANNDRVVTFVFASTSSGVNDHGQVAANSPGPDGGFNLWARPVGSGTEFFGYSAALENIFPPVGGGYVKARVQYQFSSSVDGSGNPSLDGAFRWYYGPDVNNLTLRYALENCRLINPTLVPGNPETRPYTGIRFYPHGAVDNVEWDDNCDVTLASVQVNNSLPCCADDGTGGGGGGDTGLNPDPVGLLPPWVAFCQGGGQVEELADLSDGESWL